MRHVRRARTKSLQTPGSEIRTKFVRPDHPVAYGYPEVTSVHRGRLSLYETREAELDWVVMQWGTKPPNFDDPMADNDGPWGVGSAEAITDHATGKRDREHENEKPPALVVSGGIKGGDELQGKPAILDIPVGEGRILAFNFDPIHRALTRSDFRMVWNAILNWNDLGAVGQ